MKNTGFRKREPLDAAFRRVALMLVTHAIEELESPPSRLDKALHEARRSLKRLRSLLRLLHDAFGKAAFKRENEVFRDAGRQFAPVRDATVRRETLANLLLHARTGIPPETIAKVQTRLSAELTETVDGLQENLTVKTVTTLLKEIRERIPCWELENLTLSTILKALKRDYKRGRRAYMAAASDPSTRNLHDLRKCVKHLHHHLLLLPTVSKNMNAVMGSRLQKLSRILGEDHDLAMLAKTAASIPEIHKSFSELVAKRRRNLQKKIHLPARRIYARKPGAFAADTAACWTK